MPPTTEMADGAPPPQPDGPQPAPGQPLTLRQRVRAWVELIVSAVLP